MEVLEHRRLQKSESMIADAAQVRKEKRKRPAAVSPWGETTAGLDVLRE
jgi:hypothetical protein